MTRTEPRGRRARGFAGGARSVPFLALVPLLAALLALPLAAQDGVKPAPAAPAAGAQDDGFGPPPPPATSGPKMVLGQTEYDWGSVLHGEVVEHSYPVKNEGDDVLRITSVKPG